MAAEAGLSAGSGVSENQKYENPDGTVEWVQVGPDGTPIVSVTTNVSKQTMTENWRQLELPR